MMRQNVNVGMRAPLDCEMLEAAERLRGRIVRTPLIRLHEPGLPAEIYLKLENLQPGGSFKIRPALNTLLQARPEELARGVYTASAGNMAQGLARGARALGVKLRVYAPDSTAPVKIQTLRGFGTEVVLVPFDRWWAILTEHGTEGEEGIFIHPAANPAVIAGNATIGLEVMDDLPSVDAFIVPFGAGGLISGIASAAKSRSRSVRILACETSAGKPVAAAMAAGKPVGIDFKPDPFLMGIGGSTVLPEMWPLVSALVDGTVCVERHDVAQGVRRGWELTRTVMEAAGGAALAAALAGAGGCGKVVAIISGGNIDPQNFIAAVEGRTP